MSRDDKRAKGCPTPQCAHCKFKEDTILSGSSGRLQAIEAVTTYHPSSEHLSLTKTSATEFFGMNVFNKTVMKARLPKPVFKSLA